MLFFLKKSLSEWEDALEKFKKRCHLGVQHVLRASFDGLDRLQKTIFLDVACLFQVMVREYAMKILESCGVFSGVLIDTSLIAISHRDKTLKTHDLLQDVAWESSAKKMWKSLESAVRYGVMMMFIMC